jgi:hypothetical protein
MTYNVNMDLDKESALAIQNLLDVFSGDDWASKYIQMHKYRCNDDVQNVLSMNPSAVLNMGGAPYVFEVLAAAKGLNVTSVDLEPERHDRQIDKLGLDVIGADLESVEFVKDIDLSNYEVVVLCEVFEHLRQDLIGTFSNLFAAMRPGALLYETTPNFFYFPLLIRRLFGGYSGPPVVREWKKLSEIGHMGHVREYSRRDMREFFSEVGFNVVKISGRNRRVHGRATSVFSLLGAIASFIPSISEHFAQEIVIVLSVEKDV